MGKWCRVNSLIHRLLWTKLKSTYLKVVCKLSLKLILQKHSLNNRTHANVTTGKQCREGWRPARSLNLPVWRDGLLGYGTQVALQEVPDVDAGSVVLDEKHRWPGRGPLQAGDGVARGAEAPLQHRPLGRQLVEPDAPVAAAGLRAGNQVTAASLSANLTVGNTSRASTFFSSCSKNIFLFWKHRILTLNLS